MIGSETIRPISTWAPGRAGREHNWRGMRKIMDLYQVQHDLVDANVSQARSLASCLTTCEEDGISCDEAEKVSEALQKSMDRGFERSAGILFVELMERYDGASTTSWVFSLNTALRQALGPVVSALCRRFGCRAVVMSGGIIFFLSTTACALAQSIAVVILLYGAVAGFGGALAYSPGLIMVGAYFNKYRGIATGLGTCGVGIGTFIMPPLTQIFLDTYGYFGTMLLLGAISLHLCLSGALYRPLKLHWKLNGYESLVSDNTDPQCDSQRGANDSKHSNGKDSEGMSNANYQSMETTEVKTENSTRQNDSTISDSHIQLIDKKTIHSSQTHTRSSWIGLFDLSLLQNFPFLSFCVTIFVFSIAFQTGVVFLPAIAQERGLSATESAWMLSVMGVMDTVGRVGGAGLTDIPCIRPYRTYIYNIVVVCTAVITFLCPVSYGLIPFMFVAGLYGFFTGIYISLKSVIVVDFLGQEHLNNSLGIALWFQGVGSLIGPPISGMVRDMFGSYDGAFFLGGSLTVISAVILLAGNLSYRRSLKATI